MSVSNSFVPNHPPPSPAKAFRRHPFAAAFFCTLILFLAACILFTPYFHGNDDVFKLFFAKGVGASNSPSEFIGHCNILLGFLLCSLYRIDTHIPWYGILHIAVLFGGCWATWASFFLAPRALPLRLLLLALCTSGLTVYFLTHLELTITPQIAAQGALLLIVSLAEDDSAPFPTIGALLASSLILIALWIRPESLVFTFLLAIPWLLHLAMDHQVHSRARSFIPWFLCLLVAASASLIFSSLYYRKDAGWKGFLDLNQAITTLKDYRQMPYDSRTQPFYQAVGWSPNDVLMFRDYCYVDQDIYTAPKLRYLASHLNSFFNAGKEDSESSLDFLYTSPRARVAILFLFLTVLFISTSKRLLLCASLLWACLAFGLLIYAFRCPERLYLPWLCFLPILAAYYAGTNPPPPVRPFSLAVALHILPILVMSAVVATTLRADHRTNLARMRYESDFRQGLEKLHPRDEQLFVVWDSCLYYQGIHALDDFEIYRDFHIYPLAVFQRSPHCIGMLRRFAIEGNVFLGMLDRPDVFLICRPYEGAYYVTYMHEKFGIDIRAKTYYRSPLFNVYQIKRSTI